MKRAAAGFALALAVQAGLLAEARAGFSVSTAADGFPLVSEGRAAPIYVAESDFEVVRISAECLAEDLERVTSVRPEVLDGAPSGSNAVVIGTVGSSPAIDALIADGKLDVSGIQGKWEAFVIAMVEDALPGVEKALVVAGSDRRGTAFGVFEISEAMGVSPWVWWADVTPAHRDELWAQPGQYVQGPPAVKYRGIFLNDEDWGLQPWAAKTFEPETGDIGPKTNAKICELLLRLRANHLWPAMHPSTRAFNHYPDNKRVAEDYAIVMGSSHAEPMLRNNVDEWDSATMGQYNYVTNRNRVLQYWDNRAAENGSYENIYTLGMRGIHDSPMEGGGTVAERVARLESIFADQRQILANRVDPDPARVPQVFIPYKEVLDLYKAGLRVPDDVTIMWPDDNHGYIRQLPTPEERNRSGGSGIYYHISYWGTPTDYLWLNTTSPALLWSEMSRAYDYGARQIWVLNVGDIKPGEIGTQLFLELARDPEKFRNFDQRAWLNEWAGQTFGTEVAAEIGGLLDRYYRLNHPVRPEHLNLQGSGFSHVANGDEADQRLKEFNALATEANALESRIPAALKAAYFELILYPVRCADLMNRKVLLAERSRLFAQQRRVSTPDAAAAATAAYNQIAEQTAYYNDTTADGKWTGMMDWRPRNLSVFSMPETGTFTAPAQGPLGVAVEGAARTLEAGDTATLPPFHPWSDVHRFIDIFGTGAATLTWTAKADVPWIRLSQSAGATASDTRVWVSIDWDKAPRGYSVAGSVTITDSNSESRQVDVTIFRPPDIDPPAVTSAVERNGKIEIEAERFTRATGRSDVEWMAVPGLGASEDAVSLFPTHFEGFPATQIQALAPTLEYDFHTFGAGRLTIKTACVPTYPVDPQHQLRFAIAVNDEPPQLVTANDGNWDANVLRAAAIQTTVHSVTAPGPQILRIWAVDPAVTIDRFVITAPTSTASFPTDFETEDLPVAAKSANVTYRTFDEAPASATKATILESGASGQFVTLELPRISAGTYALTARVKKNPSRGIVQMAISESATGPFTDLGSPVDLYDPAQTYMDLPPIRVTFPTAGPRFLRFTVAGKNGAASNRWICLDSFALVPLEVSKPPLTLEQ